MRAEILLDEDFAGGARLRRRRATKPIEVQLTGMEKMSAEFRARGSELYHSAGTLQEETSND